MLVPRPPTFALFLGWGTSSACLTDLGRPWSMDRGGWPRRSRLLGTRLGSISAQRTPVADKRSRSPFGSAVKAGEPCRGLAWGGEPESLNVGNLWPRKERGNLRVPRGVCLRSPAHRVGRRPPPPGRGGGGVRPVAPTSKPESERTSHNAAPYDPARIVQGDEGVGVRIHQRLSVVGRTVEHPSPAGGLDGGSDQRSEAGSLVIAERVAFDVPRPVAPQPRAPASSFRCQRSRPPRPAPGSAEWGPDAPSCA